MADQEKFEAFKKEQIHRNEDQFGSEIRKRYGKKAVEQSNKKVAEMTQKEVQTFEHLTEEINEKLKRATKEGKPESALGQEVAALHKKWITQAWPEGYYSEEKHYNLSLMYIEDPRFKAYYENIEPGAAEFLHETLKVYLNIQA